MKWKILIEINYFHLTDDELNHSRKVRKRQVKLTLTFIKLLHLNLPIN